MEEKLQRKREPEKKPGDAFYKVLSEILDTQEKILQIVGVLEKRLAAKKDNAAERWRRM